MKKKLVSFKYLPASWGLVGQIYDEAEANYYYEGEELDKKIANIRFKYDQDEEARQIALVKISCKYKHIDDYEKEIKIMQIKGKDTPLFRAEIDLHYKKISEVEYKRIFIEQSDIADVDKQIQKLHVDYDSGKITKIQYEKQLFTLEKKPWVGIIDQEIDPNRGINGYYIEFEWNKYWIEMLRDNGYFGTEEEMIDAWFSDVNNSVQLDENIVAMPLARKHRDDEY